MLPTRNKPDFKTLAARAPAKLIISGEYSVLYGQPALAMAVDRYITTTITCTNIPEINFNLLDLAYANSYTQQDLNYLAKKIHCDYNSFLSGNKNINSVLKQPCELLQYAVSNLLDILKITLPYGLNITVKSNIPIGCGMGSSAAAVISTITALADLLDCKWQRADCLNFSRKIENLQHAKSSGLDLHLVTYGGCVRFENGVANKLVIPQFPIKIVNTGTPQSNTGVCVANVASILQNNFDLANKFGTVTNQINAAINFHDVLEFKNGIKNNHRLLQQIGVVPNKVANFIKDIEEYGGAAKVCGAGAITGDNAGVVLLIADCDIQDLLSKYNYKLQSIQVDAHGITII